MSRLCLQSFCYSIDLDFACNSSDSRCKTTITVLIEGPQAIMKDQEKLLMNSNGTSFNILNTFDEGFIARFRAVDKNLQKNNATDFLSNFQ